MKNKKGLTIGLTALTTLGLLAGGVVIYNKVPSNNKISVSWGNTTILGDENNQHQDLTEIEVELSALDKLCKEQHLMYIYGLDENANFVYTQSIQKYEDSDIAQLNEQATAMLGNRLSPNDPNKVFKGWSLTKDGEIITTLPFEEKAVVLYPVFENISGVAVNFYYIGYDSPLWAEAIFSNNEYTIDVNQLSYAVNDLMFIGWTTNQDAKDESAVVDIYSDVTEGTTYYALYRNTVTGNVGTAVSVLITKFVSTNYAEGLSYQSVIATFENESEYIVERIDSQTPSFENYGYTFAGWGLYENDAESLVDFSTTNIVPGTTYYAIWTAVPGIG